MGLFPGEKQLPAVGRDRQRAPGTVDVLHDAREPFLDVEGDAPSRLNIVAEHFRDAAAVGQVEKARPVRKEGRVRIEDGIEAVRPGEGPAAGLRFGKVRGGPGVSAFELLPKLRVELRQVQPQDLLDGRAHVEPGGDGPEEEADLVGAVFLGDIIAGGVPDLVGQGDLVRLDVIEPVEHGQGDPLPGRHGVAQDHVFLDAVDLPREIFRHPFHEPERIEDGLQEPDRFPETGIEDVELRHVHELVRDHVLQPALRPVVEDQEAVLEGLGDAPGALVHVHDVGLLEIVVVQIQEEGGPPGDLDPEVRDDPPVSQLQFFRYGREKGFGPGIVVEVEVRGPGHLPDEFFGDELVAGGGAGEGREREEDRAGEKDSVRGSSQCRAGRLGGADGRSIRRGLRDWAWGCGRSIS